MQVFCKKADHFRSLATNWSCIGLVDDQLRMKRNSSSYEAVKIKVLIDTAVLTKRIQKSVLLSF